MTETRVVEEAITSPIYRIRGQRSRWRYPDPRLTAEHCEILRDVNISERGSADTRYGYITYNATAIAGGETAVGLWEGTFANGNVKRLFVTPTAVFTDTGSVRVNITGTALTGTADDRVRFVFLKDRLIFNNAVDTVRVWTGDDTTPSNTSNLTTVPWTKVDDIFVHKNLLMIAGPTESGTKYPTRIRWCDINRRTYVVDINTWIDANRYEIYDGGPRIIGVVDNWGKALVFKADGLYPGEIFYDPLGHYDFRLGEPVRGFSPISKMSLIARPEFVFGAALEGIFVVRPDLSFEIVNLDDDVEWRGLNLGRLQYSQATVREKDHQIRLLVSSSGNTSGHDRILVWDWETGDIWLDRPTHVRNYISQVTVSNEVLDWSVGTNGYLYQGNKSTYSTDAGINIEWRIKLSPNDLEARGKSKHVLNLRTFYRKRSSSQAVAMKVQVDEGRQGSVTGTLVIGTGLTWNSAVKWNSGKKWSGGTSRRATFEVNRICETIAPEWTSTGVASIDGYQVEYLPLED